MIPDFFGDSGIVAHRRGRDPRRLRASFVPTMLDRATKSLDPSPGFA